VRFRSAAKRIPGQMHRTQYPKLAEVHTAAAIAANEDMGRRSFYRKAVRKTKARGHGSTSGGNTLSIWARKDYVSIPM
jgi:hypothetical protein